MTPRTDALSRRQALGLGVGLAAGSLVAPSTARAAGFEWTQQKGKSLVVTAPLAPKGGRGPQTRRGTR